MIFNSITSQRKFDRDSEAIIKSVNVINSFQGEESFGSTLRALFWHRLKEDQKLVFDCQDVTKEDAVSVTTTASSFTYSLRIFNLPKETEWKSFTEFFDVKPENPKGLQTEEWKRLTDIEEYFQKNYFDVRIVINQTANAAVIFTSGLRIDTYHLLQTLIPRYLPGLFKEEPLTAKEETLLYSLISSESDYLKALEDLWEESGLQSQLEEAMILGFRAKLCQANVDRAKASMDDAKSEMLRCVSRYEDAMRDYQKCVMSYEGAVAIRKKRENDRELLDYLASHKNIVVSQITGNALCLEIGGYLDVFDADDYEAYSEDGDLFTDEDIWDDNPDEIAEEFGSPENRKTLFDSIFIDERFKIKVCGYYMLNVTDCYVSTADHCFSKPFEHSIVNPHYDYHRCLGDNERMINQALRDGDLIVAIEQCCAAVRAVNVNETSLTFKPMLKDLVSTYAYNSILEDKDGNCYTPVEALELLCN